MSRASVLERPIAVRAIALVGLFMLVAPLVLLLASRSADAATLCLPKKDETACIAGTMGSRAEPIEGVDVILTKPDGSTETETTEADGKFAFAVTEPGNYLVGVDPDTLPKGSELRPPADAKLQGPDGALKVDNVVLGQNYGATLTVGAPASTTARASGTEFLQSSVNGHPARPAAGPGQRRPQPDLRHHRDRELRARRAGDPGRHARLPVRRSTCTALACWLGRRDPGRHPRAVSAAGSRTASSGSRYDRRGLGLTQLMIVTIGLSLALQYTFQYTVGARTVRVVVDTPTVRDFGSVRITNQSLAAMAIADRGAGHGRATHSCAPAPAGPPARSPTTRRWPRPPASTPTR